MSKSKNSRKIIVLAAVLLIVFGCIVTVYAADGGLFDGLNGKDISYMANRDNYYLDARQVSFFKDPLGVMFLSLANLLFSMQKGMGELMVSALNFALTSNLFDMLSDFLTPFFNSMKTFIFDGFSLMVISIGAFFLIFKLIQNRQTQIITTLIQTVFILVLAGVFYLYPMQILSGINQTTTELSSAVMNAPYSTIANADDKSVEDKAAEITWNLVVHKPWQLLEFGSVQKAAEHEQKILKMKQGSQERQDYIDSIPDDNLFSAAAGYQLQRIVTSLILMLFQVVMFVVLVGFAVLIVGYQFFTLLLAFLGMFVFLMALIPYFGLELLKRWAVKILSASVVKILLVFFISMMFVIMGFMYSMVDRYGLLNTLLCIFAMLIMIWMKKREIFDLFSGYGSGRGMPGVQTMNQALDKDGNAVAALRMALNNDAGSGYTGASHKGNEGDMRSRSQRLAPSADPAYLREASEGMVRVAQITSDHYKRAEELLGKQYELSKNRSEEKAARTGEPAEYSELVKRTDAVRTLGAGEFDRRDVSNVARLIQMVEEKGGNTENLIVDQTRYDNQVQRPKTIVASGNIAGDREAGSQSAGNQKQGGGTAVIRPPQGIEYFKTNFGEEQGERFYEKMTHTYDVETVDSFGSNQKLSYAQVHQELKVASTQGPSTILNEIPPSANIKTTDAKRVGKDTRSQEAGVNEVPTAIREGKMDGNQNE